VISTLFIPEDLNFKTVDTLKCQIFSFSRWWLQILPSAWKWRVREVLEKRTRKFEKQGNINNDTENFILTSTYVCYMDSRWYTTLICIHLSNRRIKACILCYENCVSSVCRREIVLFTSESLANRLPSKGGPKRWKLLRPVLPAGLAWLQRCCWEVIDRPPYSPHLSCSDLFRKHDIFTKTNFLLQY
jgi:hypothetical protein